MGRQSMFSHARDDKQCTKNEQGTKALTSPAIYTSSATPVIPMPSLLREKPNEHLPKIKEVLSIKEVGNTCEYPEQITKETPADDTNSNVGKTSTTDGPKQSIVSKEINPKHARVKLPTFITGADKDNKDNKALQKESTEKEKQDEMILLLDKKRRTNFIKGTSGVEKSDRGLSQKRLADIYQELTIIDKDKLSKDRSSSVRTLLKEAKSIMNLVQNSTVSVEDGKLYSVICKNINEIESNLALEEAKTEKEKDGENIQQEKSKHEETVVSTKLQKTDTNNKPEEKSNTEQNELKRHASTSSK